MTYFLQSANTYKPTQESALTIHQVLPPGNYIIKQDPFKNFFLELVDNFTINTKLYGKIPQYTKRIFDTFTHRESSTGILLSGEKGSGKSLLAKNLAITAFNNNIPTLVINNPWSGEEFNQLIQSINQPAVILFDEFEKVYDRDDQKYLLTLLDGTYPTKKLFVFTCNDSMRIDSHMKNRPGRIFYMIDFDGLDNNFISEYCNDNLVNKQYIPDINKLASVFDKFNFDMLKAIVEEMNRYDESPQDVLELLNAKPELSDDSFYDVTILHNGSPVAVSSPEVWDGNPIRKSSYFDYKLNKDDEYWEDAHFSPNDLKELNPHLNSFTFTNNDNLTLVLTKKPPSKANYWGAF